MGQRLHLPAFNTRIFNNSDPCKKYAKPELLMANMRRCKYVILLGDELYVLCRDGFTVDVVDADFCRRESPMLFLRPVRRLHLQPEPVAPVTCLATTRDGRLYALCSFPALPRGCAVYSVDRFDGQTVRETTPAVLYGPDWWYVNNYFVFDDRSVYTWSGRVMATPVKVKCESILFVQDQHNPVVDDDDDGGGGGGSGGGFGGNRPRLSEFELGLVNSASVSPTAIVKDAAGCLLYFDVSDGRLRLCDGDSRQVRDLGRLGSFPTSIRYVYARLNERRGLLYVGATSDERGKRLALFVYSVGRYIADRRR